MKKYEITNIEHSSIKGLFRIRALKDFSNVKKGDLGGFIEHEHNLSQKDDAWVFDDAKISGNAWVYGNAEVYDAKISGNARVFDDAKISGNAWVSGNARVFDDAKISGNARISDDAKISKQYHVLNVTNQKFNLTITPTLVFGGCRKFTREEFLILTTEQCESKWHEWELENYKGYAKLFYERLDKLEGEKEL